MDNIKIRHRGLLVDYDPEGVHKGVIYFATDTQQLLLDGSNYGGSNTIIVDAIDTDDSSSDTIRFKLSTKDYKKAYNGSTTAELIVVFGDNIFFPGTSEEMYLLCFRYLKKVVLTTEDVEKIWVVDNDYLSKLQKYAELTIYPVPDDDGMDCIINFEASTVADDIKKLQNQIDTEATEILNEWTAKDGSNYTKDSKDITTAIYDLDKALTDAVAKCEQNHEELKDRVDEIEPKVDEMYNDLYGSGESELDTGNAVLVNKTTLEKVSVKPDELSNYSPDEWEPIGVIAIPSSHDVYGTGECGVIALMSASLTTPDVGQTSNANIYWGAQGIEYPELNNFSKVVSYGTMNNPVPLDTIDIKSGSGFLPLQRVGMNVKLQCSHDKKANYYNSTNASSGYLPSPYLNNDSRNPDYHKTDDPSSTVNALSDFSGKSNTEFLCSNAVLQESWRTDSTLTNDGYDGYQPAACACWRFHTVGTNQGDWYLPACGEFGYIASRYDLISSTIIDLQAWSNKTCCIISATGSHWTSTEFSATQGRVISFENGYVNYNTKNSARYVRPFTRLKLAQSSTGKFYTKDEVDEIIDNTKEEINNALDNKVDKDGDKQLSDENFTSEYREKLEELSKGRVLIDVSDKDDASTKINQVLADLAPNEEYPAQKFNEKAYLFNTKIADNFGPCEFKVTKLEYTNGKWWLIASSTTHYRGNRYYSEIDFLQGPSGNGYTRFDVTKIEIDKSSIGLGNVNNTSDTDKPVSTAVNTRINNEISGLKLQYDSSAKKIILKDKDNNQIAELDATEFIKDGMVESVEIKNNKLVITFNTDSGQEPIELPLDQFVNVYGTGKGIKITEDKKIELSVDEGSTDYIKYNSDGGIQLDNLVTTDTDQTIEGKKSFTSQVELRDTSTDNAFTSLPSLLFHIPNKNYAKFVLDTAGTVHLLNGGAKSFTDQYRNIKANAFVKEGGNSTQFLKADGSVDSNSYALASALGNYVNKSGDTMTGTLTIKTDTQPCLKLDSNTANKEVYMYAYSGGVAKAAFGWSPTSTTGAYLYNSTCQKSIGVRDDGTPNFAGNTLWHSGNDGSGSGLDADLLDGYHITNYQTGGWYGLSTYEYTNSTVYNHWNKIANVVPGGGQTVLEIMAQSDSNYPGIHKCILALSSYSTTVSVTLSSMPYLTGTIQVMMTTNGDVWVRPLGIQWTSYAKFRLLHGSPTNGNITVYTSNIVKQKETPANGSDVLNAGGGIKLQGSTFTTYAAGNVAGNALSANKLATARTVWGQSFDGTANINGIFREVADTTGNVVVHSILKYPANPYGLLTRIDSDGTVSLQAQRETTTTEWFKLILNPSGGNVGIGVTAPTNKLDVAGDINITSTEGLTGYKQNGNVILRHSSLKNTVLSTNGGAIYLRPNATDSSTGETTIDASGAMVINSSNSGPLNVNTTATTEVGIRLNMNGISKGWVGYSPSKGTQLYTYTGNHSLYLKEDGTAWVDNTKISLEGHTHNYLKILSSSPTAEDATFNTYLTKYVNSKGVSVVQNSGTTQYGDMLPTDTAVNFGDTSARFFRLLSARDGNLRYQTSNDALTGWGALRTILHSGNYASILNSSYIPSTAYKYLSFEKPDNGGRSVCILIADVTTWYNATDSSPWNSLAGIMGYAFGIRSGNMNGTAHHNISAIVSYTKQYRRLETDNINYLRPKVAKYNNKYYIALYMTGSGYTLHFLGYAIGLLSPYITISADTNGNFPGVETIYNETGIDHYGNVTGSVTVPASTSSMPIASGRVTGLVAGTSVLYKDGLVISNPTTANDCAWMRVTGTGESDTVLELATGDDGGTGESIVFRGYNTNNAVAYQVNVPKTSGYMMVAGPSIHFLTNANNTRANITTATFITKLTALGAFNNRYWSMKCTWAYDHNDTITDTGCGYIDLAGSVIEVFSIDSNTYTIRITTSPTVKTGGTPNAVFIYRNHGSQYSPNWKRLVNTTDLATTTAAGLMSASDKTTLNNAVTIDGEQIITGRKTFRNDLYLKVPEIFVIGTGNLSEGAITSSDAERLKNIINNRSLQEALLYMSDVLVSNPMDGVAASTYRIGTVPKNHGTLQWVSGQLYTGTTGGKAYKGTSTNNLLWSYPDGGTVEGNDTANIMNLRLSYNSAHFHDIFTSPNSNNLYHRRVYVDGSTTKSTNWEKFIMSSDLATTTSAGIMSAADKAYLNFSQNTSKIYVKITGYFNANTNDILNVYSSTGMSINQFNTWFRTAKNNVSLLDLDRVVFYTGSNWEGKVFRFTTQRTSMAVYTCPDFENNVIYTVEADTSSDNIYGYSYDTDGNPL